MFCTKCGTNVGEGIFCPKCGNRVIPTVAVTPPVAAQVATESEVSVIPIILQKSGVEEPVLSEATETSHTSDASEITEASVISNISEISGISVNPVIPGMEDVSPVEIPVANSYSFGIEKPVKKKKKWPKIVGIVAAVIVILGAGIYFAIPGLMQLVSPKAYAATAFKNTTSKLGDSLSGAITNADFSNLTTPKETSVTLQLDKLDVKDSGIMYDFVGKNVTMTIQSSASDNTTAGTISLGASGTSAISIEFYMDAKNLYFKVPQLSSKSFTISMASITENSSYSYNDIYGTLNSLSSSDIQKYVKQYSGVITAVIQDVIDGMDTVIDNADYTKIGNETYESENGDIKVSVYEVVISEEAIKKGSVAVLENVFKDKELTSYVQLLTMATSQTKESLISETENTDLGIDSIKFKVYINKNQEIVKTIYDLKEISGEDGLISIEFIGQDNIYDYIVANVISNETTVKFIAKNNSEGFYFSANIMPDQTINKDQFLNFGIQGKSQVSGSDVNTIIDKMFVVGNIEGETFDIALSGKSSTKTISSVAPKSSTYSTAINLEKMTVADQKLLLTEISKNIPNLKGKLSDKLISEFSTVVNSALAQLK